MSRPSELAIQWDIKHRAEIERLKKEAASIWPELEKYLPRSLVERLHRTGYRIYVPEFHTTPHWWKWEYSTQLYKEYIDLARRIIHNPSPQNIRKLLGFLAHADRGPLGSYIKTSGGVRIPLEESNKKGYKVLAKSYELMSESEIVNSLKHNISIENLYGKLVVNGPNIPLELEVQANLGGKYVTIYKRTITPPFKFSLEEALRPLFEAGRELYIRGGYVHIVPFPWPETFEASLGIGGTTFTPGPEKAAPYAKILPVRIRILYNGQVIKEIESHYMPPENIKEFNLKVKAAHMECNHQCRLTVAFDNRMKRLWPVYVLLVDENDKPLWSIVLYAPPTQIRYYHFTVPKEKASKAAYIKILTGVPESAVVPPTWEKISIGNHLVQLVYKVPVKARKIKTEEKALRTLIKGANEAKILMEQKQKEVSPAPEVSPLPTPVSPIVVSPIIVQPRKKEKEEEEERKRYRWRFMPGHPVYGIQTGTSQPFIVRPLYQSKAYKRLKAMIKA